MRQDIPPPPPGFQIVGQGGSVPPPPPGFQVAAPVTQPRPQARPQRSSPQTPAMVAPVAPAASSGGLSREDSINALLDQGYDPDTAIRLADEQIALDGGQASPLAGQGVGDPFNPNPSAGYQIPEGVLDYEALTPEALGQLTRGTRILLPADAPGQARQIVTLARDMSAPQRDAIMGEQRQTIGGVQTYTPGIADTVAGFTSGASEQIPFLDEAQVAADALMSGQSFSEARDDYQLMQQGLNASNRGARNAGGIAGFLGGLALPGGGYIAQGANRLQQVGRAAQVGAGYGALYGAGNTEGDLGERLQSGAQGAAIGAATGGIAQRLLARDPNAVPTAARELSREGIRLTPGQMMGGMARRIENASTDFPIVGDAIRNAQSRGMEDFNRAMGNRVLRSIGQTLPRDQAVGRPLVQEVARRVSDEYNRVLDPIRLSADDTLIRQLTRATSNARLQLRDDAFGEFQSTLQNTVMRRLLAADEIDGRTFKEIDEELGLAARAAQSNIAGGPNARYLADAYEAVQSTLSDALRRRNPEWADSLDKVDEAYANMLRLQEAVGQAGTAAREGVASPANLNSAVRSLEGGRRNANYARGQALMQDLSDRAAAVLPSNVPNSGTPVRSLMLALGGGGGGLAGAAAVGAPVGALAPAAVIGGGAALTGAAAYSTLGQNLLNAFYRAGDPAGRLAVLGQARAAAAQNPALVPYYQQLLSAFQSESPNQAPPIAPAAPAQPIPIGP